LLAPLSPSVVVFRNTSVPDLISFDPPLSFATLGGDLNAAGLAIADLDGDGLPDIVATGAASNSVSVLRNISTVGGVSFAAHFDFPAGFAPVSVAVSDLDGDGKQDLLVADG